MYKALPRISRFATNRWILTNCRRIYATARLQTRKSPVKTDRSAEALRYVRKNPIEHILLRPDTYIGSVVATENETWLFSHETGRMESKFSVFPPGLVKIFDEILVNAADNKQRDPGMNQLRVTVDSENNLVTVWNNGRSLPIVRHHQENIFIPTLIFGNLFTSSNYDDNEVKTVGGRNGYGAKLCNIYSSEFVVETANKDLNLSFRQKWTNNMGSCSEPQIATGSCEEDYTQVSFRPDLAKFGLARLTPDVVRVFERRAIDMAGTLPGVEVFFNGKRVEVDGFKDYVGLFADDFVFLNASRRWQVAVARSEGVFKHVSFVNNIATSKGGKHADHVADMVVSCLKAAVDEKLSGTKTASSSFIKSHLSLFVNSTIENPTFDSQTKVALTTPASKFGSSFHLNEVELLDWATSSGLIDFLVQELQRKKATPPSKAALRSLQIVPKLEDANLAGTANSAKCTLIITEGDSAKAFAVAGLEKVGRDTFGVFPIRGKLVNVSEMTKTKLAGNAEITNLMKILGLQFGVNYSNPEEFAKLRYGSLMILADQDEDGTHIKGLVLNFISRFWPQLIERGYVSSFRTPLIKAKRGSEVISFFSSAEFKKWLEERPDSAKFDVKYYKGLGTSTSAEAREYFSQLERHVVKYTLGSEEDFDSLRMVFEKSRSNDRKAWIAENKATDAPVPVGDSTLSEFVNTELINYSRLDLRRSIPSVVDGLKPSQRKILHCLLQRGDKKEVKVNQLAGAVSQTQGYHHGEESLVETIIRMAQDFTGVNNIPLLQPIGQFGTRHEGGDDAARGRYIFTQLSPVTRAIFPKADVPLLEILTEEGALVEPVWYCPVIPLVLVNGAQGIGTGWATTVHPHRPSEVIDNVRRLIDNKVTEDMAPFWDGFRGTITQEGLRRYRIQGVSNVVSTGKITTRLEINELPPGVWTNRYKERVLVPMFKEGLLGDIKENHTERAVSFEVTLKRANPAMLKSQESRAKLLKLVTTVSTNSMVLFDPSGTLRRYATTGDVFLDHFSARRELYNKRLAHLEASLESQKSFTENQLRFVTEVGDGTVVLQKSRRELEDELENRRFERNPLATAKGQPSDWSYLLEMPLLRLTNDEKSRLSAKLSSLETQLAAAKGTSWQQAWTKDLDGLEKELPHGL